MTSHINDFSMDWDEIKTYMHIEIEILEILQNFLALFVK